MFTVYVFYSPSLDQIYPRENQHWKGGCGLREFVLHMSFCSCFAGAQKLQQRSNVGIFRPLLTR
jgi:hypothetical protein